MRRASATPSCICCESGKNKRGDFMRYRRWLVPALAAAVLTASAPARAQDAAQDSLAELFYTYTNDNVVSEYTDPDYLAASGQTARKTCDGFLALLDTDLDWDGTQELLAIRMKPLERDGEETDSLVAEVYRRQENSLKRAAQYTLAENKLQCSEAQIDVFLLQTQSGPVLCCEARGVESLSVNGMTWSLRAAAFDGSDFQESAAHSLDGSSFEDVDFSGITDTMYRLGLAPTDPTAQMLVEQNDWVDLLCTVRRYYVADRDALNDFLASGGNGQERMQYGETWFKNYVNTDVENKLPKTFIRTDGAEDASGQPSGDAGGYSYAGDYVIPDSDVRYITYEELDRLSPDELLLARNEIYARRGRKFNDEALNAYFSSKSWYHPTVEGSDFTEDYAARVFNSYEITNISTIVTYEKEHGLNDYQ